jgi:outer membrane protein TolC
MLGLKINIGLIFYSLFLIHKTSASLTPQILKESTLRHHPHVMTALLEFQANDDNVRAARGSFDLQFVSDYKRQTKDVYRTTLSRSQIEKPLRFASSKIYLGQEQISNPSGLLAPIYNTGNPATQTGNYTLIGAKFSLWRNLLLDPERAQFQSAKLQRSQAEQNLRLTKLHVVRLALLAYWEWVTAQKLKVAYENLLKNGETRNDYLLQRSRKGDIGKVIVTENEQYVAKRNAALQAIRERLLRAELDLSLFWRDEEGKPQIPQPDLAYEDFPNSLETFIEKENQPQHLSTIIHRRPEIVDLNLEIEKSALELNLAKQNLYPQLDVTTEYFQRNTAHPNMPTDYLMVMAQVRIPLEQNLGRGQMAKAQSEKNRHEKLRELALQELTIEMVALQKSLSLQLEQVQQAEIEFKKAKELVEAENYKFKIGGGNLFLVNLREEAQTDAEASYHEAKLHFMSTLLHYQALTEAL